MLSASRTAISAMRIRSLATPSRMVVARFGTIDKLQSKEHVEEELYIRKLEAEFIAKKKAHYATMQADSELKVFEEKVAPVMAEVKTLLADSGDSISDQGIEAMARWKLGI